MDYNNDFFLAQKLKSGDVKAYDYLMVSYYQKLCSYANTLINDPNIAEDIVQNVMVKMWLSRKTINFNFSIKSYLYKSVYNEFVDQHRKKVEVIYLEKKYLEAIELVVENENLDLDKLMRALNNEINNLPSKCQKIFLLNKKEGLTHNEIAELLNISVKTIEGHITRAFKILNEKLGSQIKPFLFLLFGFPCTLKEFKNSSKFEV